MEKSILTYKNAQAWGIDLMIASMIFFISIFFLYIFSINSYNETEENMERLSYDGRIISDIILSKGYPENWSMGDVISPGILTDSKINETKLENLYYLSISQYERTKHLFNTKFDFYFFISEPFIITDTEIEGIGKPGVDIDNITSEDLYKVTRFTIYKNKPVTFYLYIWD